MTSWPQPASKSTPPSVSTGTCPVTLRGRSSANLTARSPRWPATWAVHPRRAGRSGPGTPGRRPRGSRRRAGAAASRRQPARRRRTPRRHQRRPDMSGRASPGRRRRCADRRARPAANPLHPRAGRVADRPLALGPGNRSGTGDRGAAVRTRRPGAAARALGGPAAAARRRGRGPARIAPPGGQRRLPVAAGRRHRGPARRHRVSPGRRSRQAAARHPRQHRPGPPPAPRRRTSGRALRRRDHDSRTAPLPGSSPYQPHPPGRGAHRGRLAADRARRRHHRPQLRAHPAPARRSGDFPGHQPGDPSRAAARGQRGICLLGGLARSGRRPSTPSLLEKVLHLPPSPPKSGTSPSGPGGSPTPPAWAPTRGAAPGLRDPADLAFAPAALPTVVAAVHHAADAMAAVATADREAVRVAAASGRLFIPTRLLPAGDDIPYPYAPAPGQHVDTLLATYDNVITSTTSTARTSTTSPPPWTPRAACSPPSAQQAARQHPTWPTRTAAPPRRRPSTPSPARSNALSARSASPNPACSPALRSSTTPPETSSPKAAPKPSDATPPTPDAAAPAATDQSRATPPASPPKTRRTGQWLPSPEPFPRTTRQDRNHPGPGQLSSQAGAGNTCRSRAIRTTCAWPSGSAQPQPSTPGLGSSRRVNTRRVLAPCL